MKHINQDIKTSQFNQMYLLYGEEDYLRNQYTNKLKSALLGDGDAMNLSVFQGKGVNIDSVIDLAKTLPFFADRRVIVLENTGLFKGSAEALSSYLKQIDGSTYFIFSEKEVDKRGKLYKAVKDHGYIVEFKRQDEATLRKWIRQVFAKEQMNIEERTLLLFLERTGNDMSNIKSETEKLISYCYNKDMITSEDVEAITTQQINNRIFDMIRAVAEGNQKQALSLYNDLLALKEPPMRILALLSRQFQMLLQVKSLKNKGFDNRTIAEKVGLQPFIISKYIAQCSRFKMSELRESIADCLRADEDIKTGKLNDIISVELFIIKYAAR